MVTFGNVQLADNWKEVVRMRSYRIFFWPIYSVILVWIMIGTFVVGMLEKIAGKKEVADRKYKFEMKKIK